MRHLINELDLDDSSVMKWQYRKPTEIVNIKGRMSKDLELFYKVEDVRKLFNWKKPMYQNICKLVSQQYVGFSYYAVNSELNLLIGIQAVLTELDDFNLLSEDASARAMLYEVCKATDFPHQAKLRLNLNPEKNQGRSKIKLNIKQHDS